MIGDDFSSMSGETDKIVAVSDDAGVLTVVDRTLWCAAYVARSQAHFPDVTAPRANKVTVSPPWRVLLASISMRSL